jgi:hypothetical protein
LPEQRRISIRTLHGVLRRLRQRGAQRRLRRLHGTPERAHDEAHHHEKVPHQTIIAALVDDGSAPP